MNIKNILFTIAATSLISGSTYPFCDNSITITYNTGKKKYELIESFHLDRKPVTRTINLEETSLILIHDKEKNITISSAKELAEQKTTSKKPKLEVYDITFCSSNKTSKSKDFYVLASGFIDYKKKYDGPEDYCNDYVNFINEYVAKQQTK